MKPASFGYTLAESVDEVVAILEEGDGDAMVIAGGQTLMPMLALRMARPEMVVFRPSLLQCPAQCAGVGE